MCVCCADSAAGPPGAAAHGPLALAVPLGLGQQSPQGAQALGGRLTGDTEVSLSYLSLTSLPQTSQRVANLPKGGGRGIPIQGGGKGKPGAGPASEPGTEPGAGAEVLVPAAVVVAAPLGRETAGKMQNGKSVSGSLDLTASPQLPWHAQGSPALVDGGAAASPELGGGGTGGKGPIGGHSGNMPGGKGGRRPWGTAEKQTVVRRGLGGQFHPRQ